MGLHFDHVSSGFLHLVFNTTNQLLAEIDARHRRDPAGVSLAGGLAGGGPRRHADAALLFAHADHLKRPECLTDAARSTVWRAPYTLSGALRELTGPASPRCWESQSPQRPRGRVKAPARRKRIVRVASPPPSSRGRPRAALAGPGAARRASRRGARDRDAWRAGPALRLQPPALRQP
jgi:hypothetical protein